MTEQDFLQTYNPQTFEHPSVAVDVALLTVQNKELKTLLLLRHEHPYRDFWTLPGGFVGIEESLEDAAVRILKQKAGLEDVFLEQLYTFGSPERDPRMRVISVAYYALVSFEKLSSLENTTLATLHEVKGKLELRLEGQPIQLGFDHLEILHVVLQRLRGKLEYAPLGYELLPKHFTLRELQDVHETILGRKLNKDSFRRRMLASGELVATGKMETGREFRPAEKYRRRKKGVENLLPILSP
jgi:8-oxo-dGTP diphosphatase